MGHAGGVTPPEPRARKTTRRGAGVALAGFLAGLVLVAVGAGVGLPHLEKSGLALGSVIGLVALSVGLLAVAVTGIRLVRSRRSWRRVPAAFALVVIAVLVVYVLAIPLRASLPPRAPPPSASPGGPAAQAVVVATEDGERLSAWYTPSTTGAAVVLLPGSGSSSAALGRHAEVLAGGGFGVLAVDPRGHGDSTGLGMDWGWFGETDVPAAVTFLTGQPDVDPDRIGVVGLSMGGEQAVGAAGVDPRIRAVVGEGVTGRSAADLDWLVDAYGWRGSVTRAVHRVQTTVADVLSPAGPPPPLREAVWAAEPRPVLLIVAGERPDELHAATSLQSASPESVELWVVDGAAHTAGLRTDPDGWREHVLGFLAGALGRPA